MPYADVKNSAGKFYKTDPRVGHRCTCDGRNPGRLPVLDDKRAGKRCVSNCWCDMVASLPAAKGCAKGKKLVEFLKWAAKDGEKMAQDLQYAPLPEAVQERVLKRIDEIKM